MFPSNTDVIWWTSKVVLEREIYGALQITLKVWTFLVYSCWHCFASLVCIIIYLLCFYLRISKF